MPSRDRHAGSCIERSSMLVELGRGCIARRHRRRVEVRWRRSGHTAAPPHARSKSRCQRQFRSGGEEAKAGGAGGNRTPVRRPFKRGSFTGVAAASPVAGLPVFPGCRSVFPDGLVPDSPGGPPSVRLSAPYINPGRDRGFRSVAGPESGPDDVTQRARPHHGCPPHWRHLFVGRKFYAANCHPRPVSPTLSACPRRNRSAPQRCSKERAAGP